MPSFTFIIYAVMIAAPFVTFGVMHVRENMAVSAAITAERNVAQVKCNTQLEGVTNTINAAANDRVKLALQAQANVKPTPEDKAALATLCKASQSCREHANLK